MVKFKKSEKEKALRNLWRIKKRKKPFIVKDKMFYSHFTLPGMAQLDHGAVWIGD